MSTLLACSYSSAEFQELGQKKQTPCRLNSQGFLVGGEIFHSIESHFSYLAAYGIAPRFRIDAASDVERSLPGLHVLVFPVTPDKVLTTHECPIVEKESHFQRIGAFLQPPAGLSGLEPVNINSELAEGGRIISDRLRTIPFVALLESSESDSLQPLDELAVAIGLRRTEASYDLFLLQCSYQFNDSASKGRAGLADGEERTSLLRRGESLAQIDRSPTGAAIA